MNNLPSDVLFIIFELLLDDIKTRLSDIVNILKWRRINKRFNIVISNSNF